jgi:hypothetical protein
MGAMFEIGIQKKRRAICQEHPLGCAVACVAARCAMTYRQALSHFNEPKNAWTRGFYCSEVIAALERAGKNYRSEAFDPIRHASALKRDGTILFLGASDRYPAGHYILRTDRGWMNPWINFPRMLPARAGFQTRPPGIPSYVLSETA